MSIFTRDFFIKSLTALALIGLFSLPSLSTDAAALGLGVKLPIAGEAKVNIEKDEVKNSKEDEKNNDEKKTEKKSEDNGKIGSILSFLKGSKDSKDLKDSDDDNSSSKAPNKQEKSSNNADGSDTSKPVDNNPPKTENKAQEKPAQKQPAEPAPKPTGNAFAEGMVSINFDDGWRSAYEKGMPIIDSAGFKTTHYIITVAPNNPSLYMTKEEILSLQSKGHAIENHTKSHKDLTTLSDEELKNETDGARKELLSWGAKPVLSFAYPLGRFNDKVIEAVKASGATSARTTQHGLNIPSTNPFQLKSKSLMNTTTFEQVKSDIDKAISEKGWYIMTLHEIDSGREYSISSALLKQIVDYLKEKNVKVVTNAEGVSYMKGNP